MAKKEPLYPHIPKSRKRGTNAWRCKQCGWTTWNIIYCPKCGSRDLEELTTEEVTSFYETGSPVIHPRTEPEEGKYYYCDNTRLHSNNEVIQIKTTEDNPKCPYCGAVMTYGRYWGPLPATQL